MHNTSSFHIVKKFFVLFFCFKSNPDYIIFAVVTLLVVN